MKKTYQTLAALILLIIGTTTTAAAYGQNSAYFFGDEITEEQEQAIIADLIEKIQAYGNDTRIEPYIFLDDEGRMTLSYDNETSLTIADDIDVHFPHEYTPENGYTFRDNNVFKPDGTELFP